MSRPLKGGGSLITGLHEPADPAQLRASHLRIEAIIIVIRIIIIRNITIITITVISTITIMIPISTIITINTCASNPGKRSSQMFVPFPQNAYIPRSASTEGFPLCSALVIVDMACWVVQGAYNTRKEMFLRAE